MTQLLTPIDEAPEKLATRLLQRFGSLGRIAQASEAELRQVARVGERWISAFLMMRQLMRDGMREDVLRTNLDQSRTALYSYLFATMQRLSEERVLAIFADAAGYIIAEEILAEGEHGYVQLTPRRLFGRAMNLDSRRILLAHNHPSGCADPSAVDIEQTRVLCRQALSLGIVIDDHLIVGRREVVSMKNRGLL